MKIEDVKRRLDGVREEFRKYSSDAAHRAQDELYESVLQAIADGVVQI